MLHEVTWPHTPVAGAAGRRSDRIKIAKIANFCRITPRGSLAGAAAGFRVVAAVWSL